MQTFCHKWHLKKLTLLTPPSTFFQIGPYTYIWCALFFWRKLYRVYKVCSHTLLSALLKIRIYAETCPPFFKWLVIQLKMFTPRTIKGIRHRKVKLFKLQFVPVIQYIMWKFLLKQAVINKLATHKMPEG